MPTLSGSTALLSPRNLCLLLLLLLVLPGTLFGQGIVTGSITGTVLDSTGAVIPNALIKATQAASGASFSQNSEQDGVFAFRALPLGSYTVTVAVTGFQTVKFEQIVVNAGGVADLKGVTLTPGAQDSVTVEDKSLMLETTQSQISTTFSSMQVTDLPLGGQNYDSLALLLPGVVQTHSDGFSNSNGANFSANGDRGRSNNFELDGTNNNDNSIAGPQIFFHNADALAEVQFVTNNFSAQYGHNMGAVVNYVTKTGGNSFHGSAYEFYTGSWSYSLRNQDKNPLLGYCIGGVTTGCSAPRVFRQDTNNFGGTFGGPILKDKLWFFGAGTGLQTRNGTTNYTNSSLFPTPAGLQALKAAYPSNPAVAALAGFGPYGIGGGSVAPIVSSTTSQTVSDGTTSVAIPVAGFARSLASLSNEEEALGRLDYQLHDKDHIFFRYFYQDQITTAGSGVISTGGYVNVPDTAHSVGGDWTHTFSPNWVNQVRYSFQQTRLFFEGGGVPSCTGKNLASCPASVALGSGFASFGLATNLPQGREVKETEVQDNANWTHGHHSVAFGGESLYQNSPNVFLPDYNGGYSFPGAVGADPISQLLQGTGSLTLGNGNVVIPFSETDYALYIQDDWKVLPNLTLNAGLRWEFFGQAVNLLHTESIKQQAGSNPFWNTSLPQSITTYPYTNPYYKNFEPRVGFNYAPTQKVVVRGGFAIGVDPAFYNIFLNSATAAPVINLGTFACGSGAGTTHQCLPAAGVSSAAVRTQNLGQIPTGVNPGSRNYTTNPANFRNPYSENYSLGVQYQVGAGLVTEVRYVGVHGAQLFQNVDGNPNLGSIVAAFPSYYTGTLCSDIVNGAPAYDNGRVRCGQGNVRARENTAFSSYNALQLNLRTTNYHGLTGSASYTYSKTIDNASEIYSTASGGQTIAYAQDPRNVDLGERGQSGNNFPSVASVGLIYQTPKISSGNTLVRRMLNGYNVGTIYTYDSGQPYTIFQARAASPVGALIAPPAGSKASHGTVALAPNAKQSFCDGGSSSTGFNAAFVTYDACRPILSNKSAPLNSVGINTGLGSYVDYYTGLAAPRANFHWLWSNQAEALALGNPFPGVGRNTLRGQKWTNMDANVYKNTEIKEGVSMELQMNVFNILNHPYEGTPDNYLEDYNLQGSYKTNIFLTRDLINNNRRSMQLGAKVRF